MYALYKNTLLKNYDYMLVVKHQQNGLRAYTIMSAHNVLDYPTNVKLRYIGSSSHNRQHNKVHTYFIDTYNTVTRQRERVDRAYILGLTLNEYDRLKELKTQTINTFIRKHCNGLEYNPVIQQAFHDYESVKGGTYNESN